MIEDVKIGRVYRHFKGNYYFVENVGLGFESQEKLVIYKSLYDRADNNIFVCPEKKFLEEISNIQDNLTGQSHRFELCTDIEKNYTK